MWMVESQQQEKCAGENFCGENLQEKLWNWQQPEASSKMSFIKDVQILFSSAFS